MTSIWMKRTMIDRRTGVSTQPTCHQYNGTNDLNIIARLNFSVVIQVFFTTAADHV